jgi:hypothetical protein
MVAGYFLVILCAFSLPSSFYTSKLPLHLFIPRNYSLSAHFIPQNYLSPVFIPQNYLSPIYTFLHVLFSMLSVSLFFSLPSDPIYSFSLLLFPFFTWSLFPSYKHLIFFSFLLNPIASTPLYFFSFSLFSISLYNMFFTAV